MAKLPFDADAIGKYKRSYDDLSEDDAEKGATQIIAQNLAWLKEKVPEREPVGEGSKNRLRDLLNAGLELEKANDVSAIAAIKNASQKGTLVDKAVDVMKDLYYGARDILSGRRVRTSLTIAGGIALGAGIGIVLGTLVFPGIGSAIGGAVGAALTGAVAAVGGTVGLAVLGAFVGSLVGKKVSNKAFKQEKRFEVSHRITRKIKQRVGISSKTVHAINGYLYNRAKSVKSPILKKQYKALRRLGIMEADPTAMEKIARFFCQELVILEKEMQGKNASPQLRQELEAVVYILKKLNKAEHLSLESKAKIAATFDDFKKKHRTLPISHVQQGLELDSKSVISPEILESSKTLFMEHVPELEIKSIKASDRKSNSTISYRYDITTKDDVALPTVIFKGKKDHDHYQTMVTVNANRINKSNQSQIAKVIVAQAKAHHENTGKTEVTILAAGNDELAVQLVAGILNIGLKPNLDNSEYPPDNPQAQARKKDIMAKAQALAKDSPKSRLTKSRNMLDL